MVNIKNIIMKKYLVLLLIGWILSLHSFSKDFENLHRVWISPIIQFGSTQVMKNGKTTGQ